MTMARSHPIAHSYAIVPSSLLCLLAAKYTHIHTHTCTPYQSWQGWEIQRADEVEEVKKEVSANCCLQYYTLFLTGNQARGCYVVSKKRKRRRAKEKMKICYAELIFLRRVSSIPAALDLFWIEYRVKD